MGTLDPAAEFLRITERYRQMSDSELLALIPQSSQLTPLAQQALANEVRQRGLKPEDEEAAVPAKPEPQPVFYGHDSPDSGDSSGRNSSDDADSSYDEDRELVELCTVWSLPDALQVQTLLDRAGIPFFLGPEKATGADAGTLNFVNGVNVQVMRIGLPWAAQAMQNYEPANEPAPKYNEQLSELPVRCPKCGSTEVILEDAIAEPAGAAEKSSSRYKWSCDSCGQRWEDDGVAKEG